MNTPVTRRLRILVSAYSCEPGRGSEPGVGWSLAKALARNHDVVVLTRKYKASMIGTAIEAEGLAESMQVIPFDLPRCTRFWQRGTLAAQSHYYLWQLAARGLANDIVRYHSIDLVHHVTFGRYWSPSCLAAVPVPFVWGPLGGGEKSPASFLPTLGSEGRIYEETRQLAQRTSRHDPLWRATVKAADLALGSTPETADRLRAAGCRRVENLLQMGMDPADVPESGSADRVCGAGFRVMSAGRLIPWKGTHLALSAFADFARKNPSATYWIAGDGPQRAELEQQASELGVASRIRFCGNIARSEALQMLRGADVLIHPSLHDQAPAAVFEAMLARKPVICLNLGGPPIQVGPRAGCIIAAHEPAQAIADMSAALSRLAADPILRGEMGAAGRQRVLCEFSWEEKARQMGAIYQEVLAGCGRRRGVNGSSGVRAEAV